MAVPHRNDEIQQKHDPERCYRDGVIQLEEAEKVRSDSRGLFVKVGEKVYNCHNICGRDERGFTILDSPPVAYGVRWDLDKYEVEEYGLQDF